MSTNKKNGTDFAIWKAARNGKKYLIDILNVFVELYNHDKLVDNGQILYDYSGDEVPFGYDRLRIETHSSDKDSLIVVLTRFTRPRLCDDEEQLILTLVFEEIIYHKDLALSIRSFEDEDFLNKVENNTIFKKIQNLIPNSTKVRLHYDA